jgi:hypothetical protein
MTLVGAWSSVLVADGPTADQCIGQGIAPVRRAADGATIDART